MLGDAIASKKAAELSSQSASSAEAYPSRTPAGKVASAVSKDAYLQSEGTGERGGAEVGSKGGGRSNYFQGHS